MNNVAGYAAMAIGALWALYISTKSPRVSYVRMEFEEMKKARREVE